MKKYLKPLSRSYDFISEDVFAGTGGISGGNTSNPNTDTSGADESTDPFNANSYRSNLWD